LNNILHTIYRTQLGDRVRILGFRLQRTSFD
jgi:hypothetical protein